MKISFSRCTVPTRDAGKNSFCIYTAVTRLTPLHTQKRNSEELPRRGRQIFEYAPTRRLAAFIAAVEEELRQDGGSSGEQRTDWDSDIRVHKRRVTWTSVRRRAARSEPSLSCGAVREPYRSAASSCPPAVMPQAPAPRPPLPTPKVYKFSENLFAHRQSQAQHSIHATPNRFFF